MRKEILFRFYNVTLRGVAMFSRFFLLFALAKFLAPEELGLFGLMVVTISFSMLLIGADFYTYSHRELLASESDKYSFILQQQILAHMLLYVLLLPFFLALFWFELLPSKVFVWFFTLLIVEHISQEINRLLVVLHKQIVASWVLFIRTGLWVFFVIPVMWLNPNTKHLDSVFFAWLSGGLLATLIGVAVVKDNIVSWGRWTIDKTWIKKGFRVGAGFLVATLCFKGLQTFDRYMVEFLDDAQILGVYVLYVSVVMGMVNFLEPGVFSFLYPRLVQAHKKNNQDEYNKTFKELMISTVIIASLLLIVSWIVIPYVLEWIGKPVYTEYLSSLYILIMAGFVYAIGMIPHYGLYAKSHDKILIMSHVISLPMFFIAIFALAGHIENGIKTISIALLTAFTCIALIKLTGYWFYSRVKTEPAVMIIK